MQRRDHLSGTLKVTWTEALRFALAFKALVSYFEILSWTFVHHGYGTQCLIIVIYIVFICID